MVSKGRLGQNLNTAVFGIAYRFFCFQAEKVVISKPIERSSKKKNKLWKSIRIQFEQRQFRKENQSDCELKRRLAQEPTDWLR